MGLELSTLCMMGEEVPFELDFIGYCHRFLCYLVKCSLIGSWVIKVIFPSSYCIISDAFHIYGGFSSSGVLQRRHPGFKSPSPSYWIKKIIMHMYVSTSVYRFWKWPFRSHRMDWDLVSYFLEGMFVKRYQKEEREGGRRFISHLCRKRSMVDMTWCWTTFLMLLSYPISSLTTHSEVHGMTYESCFLQVYAEWTFTLFALEVSQCLHTLNFSFFFIQKSFVQYYAIISQSVKCI